MEMELVVPDRWSLHTAHSASTGGFTRKRIAINPRINAISKALGRSFGSYIWHTPFYARRTSDFRAFVTV